MDSINIHLENIKFCQWKDHLYFWDITGWKEIPKKKRQKFYHNLLFGSVTKHFNHKPDYIVGKY